MKKIDTNNKTITTENSDNSYEPKAQYNKKFGRQAGMKREETNGQLWIWPCDVYSIA
jgi:hypothetical protein